MIGYNPDSRHLGWNRGRCLGYVDYYCALNKVHVVLTADELII